MFTGQARSCSLVALALLPVLLSVVPLCGSQSNIQCGEGIRVELDEDGNLDYGTLPPNSPPDTEGYSPQGLEGWYDLARGFVNTVQPDNLPYDVIEDTINDNNLQCSVGLGEKDENGDCEGGDFDARATLEDFGKWWAPLIAVTVLGGVMAIAFATVGCVFWCCRCCGQCGGSRSKKEPQDCCMFVTTILLLLIALLLLVGVVLSFYSNQQSYDTIESLKDTLDSVITTAVDYMDSVLNDGDTIFCQFIQVTDIALDEADRLNNSLNELIDEVGVDVDTVLQQLDGLSSGINETGPILSNVSDTTQSLQSRGAMLDTSLATIATNVQSLQTQCTIAALGAVCSNIPDPSTFTAEANFSALPDVTPELNDVQNALNGIDIPSSIQQGNDEFERITGEIQSEVNSHLGGLDGGANSTSVLSSLTDANDTLFENRDRVIGDIREVIRNNHSIDDCPSIGDIFGGNAGDEEITVGFIRQCYINQIFEQVQEYDVYRYAFGIIICCLSLLVMVLTVVGITLGVLGWRKDRSPNSRTSISHCGGIFLLVTVGLTFLFGFILLILACLAFFFGSNMQKICQAIEPTEYELYTRIVDNRELWGGSLLGNAVLGKGENLSLSGALRSCGRNEALYTAFNLSILFDVRQELLNTTDIFDELEEQVDDTIDSFNYTSDSFLDNSTRSALNDFSDSSVDSINITAFREELDNSIVAFNITTTITDLETLRDQFTTAGETALATATQTIIDELVAIRDDQIPDIQMDADTLSSQVTGLSTHIDGIVVNTNTVVDDIDGLVTNLTGAEFRDRIRNIAHTALQNLERYIDSFLNHTATSIEMNVGQCRPLATIYSDAYEVACLEAVDGLNGYWWSLGFCGVCFIPLIILAVIASTHYLRQKKESGDDAYSDYPMKPY